MISSPPNEEYSMDVFTKVDDHSPSIIGDIEICQSQVTT